MSTPSSDVRTSSMDFARSIDRRWARQSGELGRQIADIPVDKIDDSPHDGVVAQQSVMTKPVSLDKSRVRHARGQSQRVLEWHLLVVAVVHEERRQLQLLELLDTVHVRKGHAVASFESPPHRIADTWSDPQQARE